MEVFPILALFIILGAWIYRVEHNFRASEKNVQRALEEMKKAIEEMTKEEV